MSSTHIDDDLLAGFALLDADDPERRQAEAHLAGCSDCRARADASMATLALLDSLPPPPAPDAARLASIRARLDESFLSDPIAVPSPAAHDGRMAAALTVAVGVASLVIVHGLITPPRLVAALATLGVATWVAARGGRSIASSAQALTIAFAVSVLLGVVEWSHVLGADGLLGQPEGCERVIGFAAILPGVAALMAARRRPRSRRDAALYVGSAAAAGALAGQAAILTACGSEVGFLHIAGYHVLVTLAVGVMGLLAGSATARTA